MKKDAMELVFILDRSGSMAGLESDTIGGYNGMLEKQRKEEGEVRVTTVLFDDRMDLVHDRIALQGITPLTEKEYYVRGSTALLDAVGNTLNKMINVQRHTAKEEQAKKVLVVIITDGMENASREFSKEKIRSMIRRQTQSFGWEFLFLGANIDAVSTARDYGIQEDRAVDYHADEAGTRLSYEVISETVSHLRASRELSTDWKEAIRADHKSRSKGSAKK